MSGQPLADRLRANLAAAEVPASTDDVDRVLADGRMQKTEELVDRIRAFEGDDVPVGLSHAGPGPARAPGSDVAGDDPPDDPGSIAALGLRMRRGDVSPVELTEAALARIDARDGVLNAFQLVLSDRALESARRAEQELSRGVDRGPLHGIPLAVKDLLAMRGTVTTSGSRLAGDEPTDFDAAAVQRLEEGGAILVGKTRLPEFAFLPGSANPHYGPTANPHDPARDAGGSSSGSGAAVGDGMVSGAIGTDTGGSIRIPAALCGVVGLKPTFGRTSLFGCTPLAWSLDHLGPLARCVDDAWLMLTQLAGEDARDARTRPGTELDPAARPSRDVRGLRVGVPTDGGTGHPPVEDAALKAWEASTRALEVAGAEVVEVELLEMTTLRAASFLILSAEAATYHAPTLGSRYCDYGAPCRDRLLGGFAYTARDLVQAGRFVGAARRRWGALFETIDVLSLPAQPGEAPALGEPGSARFTNPFNALGLPAVTVPFGTGPGGLPLASQIVGAAWDERTVLGVARALETAE